MLLVRKQKEMCHPELVEGSKYISFFDSNYKKAA